MGGKKKIQKAPKPREKSQSEESSVKNSSIHEDAKPSKVKKGSKSKQVQSKKLNIFSNEFYNRIDAFKNFYEEFLQLRGGDDNPAQELLSVVGRVSGKIEESCSVILKDDLKDAQKWIEEQQQSIQKQIESTQNAKQTIKIALTDAGTLSPEEIKQQIEKVGQKKDKLEKSLADFEALKCRAHEIYNSKMDEQ